MDDLVPTGAATGMDDAGVVGIGLATPGNMGTHQAPLALGNRDGGRPFQRLEHRSHGGLHEKSGTTEAVP